MKTRIALAALCSVLLIGCDHSKEEELQQQVSQLQGERMSLHESVTERDKYIEDVMKAVNEVYADIEKSRVKEAKLVERSGGSEGPVQFTNADTRQTFLKNISDIGAVVKANQKKIADLQTKVKSFRGEIAGLNKLIDNLKQSLQEREQSIAQLEGRVRGLETTVAENTKVIAEKETMIDGQQKQLTTAYYVVGTRKELKEKGIITNEGGFLWGLLGSTIVMASDVDKSLFTAIDKTKEQTISVQGEIDEILPHRNEQVFATAKPVENTSALTIVSPEKFWQDNYLVIVVD